MRKTDDTIRKGSMISQILLGSAVNNIYLSIINYMLNMGLTKI